MIVDAPAIGGECEELRAIFVSFAVGGEELANSPDRVQPWHLDMIRCGIVCSTADKKERNYKVKEGRAGVLNEERKK